MSVRLFLQSVRKSLEVQSKSHRLHFVTGNQSADLDSVVSALSFSYLSYKYDSSVAIPLINIPRKDFKLRRDIKLVLEAQEITEDQLYFIEDFKSITQGHSKVEITLVDHCNLQGETLHEYAQQDRLVVKSIIDHHEDEQVFLDAVPRIIKPNGSCSSLVFNYWSPKINESILKENNAEIIKLLLAPLIIDTSNMSQKVEEDDKICMASYKKLLHADEVNVESSDSFIEDYFNTIKTAKKDLEGFKFEEILRKDYKQFKFNGINVGFSSIGKSIYWLLKTYTNEDILSGIEDICGFYNLDALIITPSFSDKQGNFRRELMLTYDSNTPFINDLEAVHQKVSTLELNLDVYHKSKFVNRIAELNSSKVIKIFNQKNLAASRKQIVPAFKQALEYKSMY